MSAWTTSEYRIIVWMAMVLIALVLTVLVSAASSAG